MAVTSDLRSPGRGPIGQSTAAASGLSWLAALFIWSLLLPIQIRIGTLILLPHRIFLLVVFVPLLIKLFSGQDKVRHIDWLLLFATFWACLAIVISGGFGRAIEPAGVFTIEFFGAYLLARVCIRSAADFKRVVASCFLALLVLTPLVVVEAVTHRPITLNLIPNSFPAVYAEPRLGLRRVQGPFAHPILFGAFASACFGLMAFGLSGTRRVMGAGMAALGSFLSLSTGAFISVIIQVILISWELVTKRIAARWRIFAALCASGYILIDLLSNRTPWHVLVTYASFSSHSAYNRILIWQFGTENVWANPLFGLGLNVDNWSRPSWMSSSADNFWLLMAMTYGLPMFLAFAGAVVMIIRSLSRMPLVSDYDKSARTGFLVAVGGIIVAGGTVHFWHSMMSFTLFFFGTGVWLLSQNTDPTAANLDAPTTDENTRRYTRFPQHEDQAAKASEPDTSDAPQSGASKRLSLTRQSVKRRS
jgi:hypothetical protein